MNTDNHGEENSPFRRRRLPSLNALRCFEAAARLENFSRAAVLGAFFPVLQGLDVARAFQA
ncbi:LysR family transcriptional regulator, partial [Pseudomonas aeruginosa]|nr:LysR family transcriptional regulator [Pseudomonas aeruginosa]